MTKADIVAALAERTKTTKAQAEASLEGLLEIIQTTLVKEGKITLTGFGSFEVRKRNARTGRNPQTGAAIKIPASKAVGFSAGKGLKDACQKAKV